VDHVVRLLNLDVPSPPEVVLEAVTSDSVSLQWQVPDKQSVSKHLIQLNGTIIGESDKKDTNVIITGLNPNQLYCVRVIAANAQRLHSSSEIIRVRTKPRSTDSQPDTHGITLYIQLTRPRPSNPNTRPTNRTITLPQSNTIPPPSLLRPRTTNPSPLKCNNNKTRPSPLK
jgi:hypothetical protein